jgi:hypothetical protein
MKALRNLLLAGAALAPLAPLAAHAQVALVPAPSGQSTQPPIVVYNYTEQHLPRCSDLTNCTDYLVYANINITPAQRDRAGGKLQYLISAKTTMHNFEGSAQEGTCVLFAYWPTATSPSGYVARIIDKTTVRMGENGSADQQSIALQGAFIDPGTPPWFRFYVGCTTWNGDALETVLTAIPFQSSPLFICPGLGGVIRIIRPMSRARQKTLIEGR